MPDPTAVDVYASIKGDNVLAGRLHFRQGRRAETATFSYRDSYLADPRAYALEPGLPLFSGAQHTPAGLALFRSFADSSPDRWGRRLIARAERIHANEAHSTARTLGEFAYLLGVRDDLRQGALRFAEPDTTTFLTDNETGVPALTDLPKLLDLADRAENDTADYDDLRTLLRAGSSLGGARPKAHVRTDEGQVAIAKFPSAGSDTWNVMAWEKTAFDLARTAGITVPPSRLLRIGGRDIHIIDRFDRSGDIRLGYVSAMTPRPVSRWPFRWRRSSGYRTLTPLEPWVKSAPPLADGPASRRPTVSLRATSPIWHQHSNIPKPPLQQP